MKKHLFCIFVFYLVVLLSLISCKQPVSISDNNLDPDIFIVNISQETNWDYMVVGKDGSSLFFNVANTDIPTRLFLRPNNNSDAGFTFIFKENGLPDKMIANGYVLYFGNFSRNTFDLAIICPLRTIEYHFGIRTGVNWNVYNEIPMPSLSQERIISLPRLNRSLNLVSNAIGIGTCAAGVFFLPALGGCAAYVASLAGSAVVDNVFNGITADVLNMGIDMLGCVFGNAFDCIVAFSNTAYTISSRDFNLSTQLTIQINEAARRIDGDGLRIIPPERLADLLSIGIEINHGNNPPNIEGTFVLWPLEFVRNTGSGFFNVASTNLRFSNQDNQRMTVSASGWTWFNTDSFITGSGNKFTAFIEFFHGGVIDIYSGEITPTGIRNFQMVEIRPNGYLGMWIDSDGFSERTSSMGTFLMDENLITQSYSEEIPSGIRRRF